MATTSETDLAMVRGDTFAFAVEIEGLDEDLDTCFFSCKTAPDDTEYVFQKSLEIGITKVETGKYRIRLAPEDTFDVALGDYYYDVQIGLNSDIYTILRGKFSIVYDITRDEE